MYDAGYRDWEELFANESEENITAMIENGLDESTKTRLGTEEAFFAACMRFGTHELVRNLISKGHNPKELETDGIFPGDILADCVKFLVESGADVNARNNDGYTPLILIDFSRQNSQPKFSGSIMPQFSLLHQTITQGTQMCFESSRNLELIFTMA